MLYNDNNDEDRMVELKGVHMLCEECILMAERAPRKRLMLFSQNTDSIWKIFKQKLVVTVGKDPLVHEKLINFACVALSRVRHNAEMHK